MQFQHGTQLPALVAGGIGTQAAISPTAIANGSGMNILTSASPTYATTLQGILLSWTGVTAAGQVNFQYSSGVNMVVYQTTGAGSIYIPCNGLALTNFGLHIANNSTGGSYSVTVFYTVIST